ncbi:MAG: DUF4215 domain-containing protein [Deltaproteobacteria bacterium]|nr:DUF4215 domain-containing protein [Deltaproteobacteria bacterium]
MQPTCDSGQQCNVASTITICEDGDRCTEDACNAMGGCEYLPITGCAVQTGDLADYAVAGDGSIFTVQTTSDRVLGRCYLPNGNPRTIEFDVSSASVASVEPGGTQVLSSRDTGISLVSFVLRDTAGDTNTRIFVSQLYDADCQKILATPIFWPAPISPNLYFDTAMDASGNFALLWQNAGTNSHTFLTLYDSAGNRIGPEGLLVNNANQCSSGSGFHVALRPDGSGGVVTCQLYASAPIRYRRFDAGGNFLDGTDSNMPELANTSGNNSSAYWTHQIAINDNDVIAVEWQNQYDYTYELDLLNADGSLRAHRVIGPASSSAVNGFKAFHQKVALLGNDFILRDNESPVTLYRVDQEGQLLGCDRLDYLNTSLRSSGSVLHMLDGDRVVRDVVNFDSWLGCAPSGCGNGGPDPHEGCDDGNLLSFDGCNEFCDIEACGDGVVTGLETCDDGNHAPNDGCDPLCQLQDPQAPDEPILGPADDFDVAADGRMITARLENGTVFATCYAPDKSLLRARFPLTRGRVASPQVVMSRNGTLSLVAWRDLATHKIMGSWLGPQCQLFHHSRELLSSESYSYAIAMDDQNRAAAMVGNHVEGMRLALFGPLGVRVGSELIQNCGGTSRGHLALNQASGGGVISCAHSSDHFSFRRFDASANWVDAGLRDVDVVLSDMEPGGGPAVGMNDLGQFVFQWRSYDEYMHAEFFDSDGSFILTGVTSMKQRELWGPYDTFALYQGGRMEIPLSGNNFVLGEVFTEDTSDRSCVYSMFTPFGLFLGSFETDLAMPFINTARMDEQDFIYFRKNQSVHFLDSPF